MHRLVSATYTTESSTPISIIALDLYPAIVAYHIVLHILDRTRPVTVTGLFASSVPLLVRLPTLPARRIVKISLDRHLKYFVGERKDKFDSFFSSTTIYT